MWIALSGEVFSFGPGGVVAIVENSDRFGNKSQYKTELVLSNGKIFRVMETIDEIKGKLLGTS
jgi:hypothetical protein